MNQRQTTGIPRGVEVLVKKAAVDGAFRERLLAERARAADAIGLSLTAAEAAMLDAVPAAQLERIVAQTAVPPRYRAAFMGYAAAAMLAAVTPVIAKTNDAKEPNIEKYGWDDYGIINGVLPKDIFGEDLSGVTVEISGTKITYVTDSSGYFECKPINPGTYAVRFIRNNVIVYSFGFGSVDAVAGCTSTIRFQPPGSEPKGYLYINPIKDPSVFYGANVSITPNADYGKVRGLVLDGSGSPIPGALVVVKGTNRFDMAKPDGAFLIKGIPEGEYEVKASRVGYGEMTKKHVGVRDNKYTDLSFTLIAESCGGIRPGDESGREEPSALNTLMNKLFGK